jgi:peptide/nickel transport system substrate-binding protein
VKFSFERAKAPGSTNKAKKAVFDNISSVSTPDAHTVILVLDNADAMLPFRLGENTAVILHPNSAASAATKPVGTGPFKLDNWAKGSAVTLVKWDGYRDARQGQAQEGGLPLHQRPAAQVAALLAGDIDGMPRFGAPGAASSSRRQALHGRGGQHGRQGHPVDQQPQGKPFNDVRVRRALAHAVDRKAFIDGAQEGLGRPIGSHFAPTDLGYLDLTKTYPYDPEKAKALLRRPASPRR